MTVPALVVTCYFSLVTSVNAQTPASWQQNATGLRTQNNTDKKTAGLGFIVYDKGWPMFSLHGGVQDGGFGTLAGPVGIELGLVKIPGASSSFSSEVADWSGNQMTFNGGTPSQLKVWASRLTSSLLVQSQSNNLRLFAGNLRSYSFNGTTVTNKTAAPSYPKYIAYSSGGNIQVRQLSTTSLSLPTLDNNWVLIWYGNNSHFADTKKPITYPYTVVGSIACCNNALNANPAKHAYLADAPMLLTFQNNPSAIIHSPEGGVDLTFGSQSGYVTMLPIFGREHPAASVTENWGVSGVIPNTVSQKISFWVQRSCDFPSSVSEFYSYNSASDTVTVTDNVTFIPTGCSGTKFAPISPMLGVAKDALGVQFSALLVSGGLASEFGPIYGIENTSFYTWSLSGLKKYIDMTRPLGSSGQPPPELMQALTSEVDKITQAGHYSPWVVGSKMSPNMHIGEIYFLNPADIIYILTEVIPILPDPQKTNLINYLKSERSNFPPETIFNLTLGQGALRGEFNLPDQPIPGGNLYSGSSSSGLPNARKPLFLKRVPLYNFYGLSRYYDITGDPVPASVMSAGKTAFDLDMAEQDFASSYWFKGFDDRKTAVENVNRHFAGLLGLTRLSKKAGDSATENLTASLLAKAAVARVGAALYPRYLYASNLVELPSDPAWHPKTFTGTSWFGVLYNYSWAGSLDDARQVTTLNQYELTLHDSSAYRLPNTIYQLQVEGETAAYLPSFRNIVPETALLLRDSAKADSEVSVNKFTAILPQWYSAFAEAIIGGEHGFTYPIDSYSTFLAKAWISGEAGQNLEKYLDISWLSGGGDLFYVHKLAETARAYMGGAPPQPTPTSTPGGGGGILPTPTPTPVPQGINISNLTDNRSSYQTSQVPTYEKFEISFNVNNISATNLQLPYDATPPAGLVAGQGITVNAEFSQDNFQTKQTIPAFYYQDFDYQVKSGSDWIYPKNQYSWKVRFAPPKSGNWQYRITATDSSGTATSQTQTFTAATSSNKGFIRVSPKDSRYFEFEDGTYFPGLGYNMNFWQISWNNPIQENQSNFTKMGQNGIQLIRHWLPQWGIFGSQDNPWTIFSSANDARIRNIAYPGSDVSMALETYWAPCEFLGWLKKEPAVKPNTTYRISIRFLIPQDLQPLDSSKPHGLVAKTGGWLQGPGTDCFEPGVGSVVSPYKTSSPKDGLGNAQWSILQGTITTGPAADFLPKFYLVLENMDHSPRTTAGQFVYIDRVDIEEDLGGGQLGVNIVNKPWMAHHQYFDQRQSFAFDKVLDLANQNDVYLKLVGLEKNEIILNSIDNTGVFGAYDTTNAKFYGDYRNITKVRWLQQAWWRYLQARWGYSTNIHSWELLNEGDPFNSRHYTLADEFGKYMKQFAPNHHLVTTSTWNSYPKNFFWSNSSYPNVDYADLHQYIYKDLNINLRIDNAGLPLYTAPNEFYDSVAAVEKLSKLVGAKNPLFGVNKPVMRGETGLVVGSATNPTGELVQDSQGIWLHKFIWAGINSGGVLDSSYWYTPQIWAPQYTGATFDHRNKFGKYYNFIKNIPLNNGNYVEAAAIASDTKLRVLGQKDPVLGRAHLWIDNKTHTWGNVVNNVVVTPASGIVTISGMPNTTYDVSWYDTYTGSVTKTETVTALAGIVALTLPQTISADIAVKVSSTGAPLPTPVPSTACSLNPGTWNPTSAVQGNSVTLNISGTGTACSGKQVALAVFKNGIFGGLAGSGPIPSLVTLSPSGLASATWTAEFTTDPASLFGPNQYYFNTTLVGGTPVSSSLLNVSSLPQGGGGGLTLTVPPTAPSATITSSSVRIDWTTNLASSTIVDYGLIPSLTNFTTAPNIYQVSNATPVISHSTVLTNLIPCTRYGYQVKSTDANNNTVTSAGSSFATSGCTGGSPINFAITGYIVSASGGSINLVNPTTQQVPVTLNVPQLFYNSNAYFQMKKLSQTNVLPVLPAPSGLQPAGDNIYTLNAYISQANQINQITTFNNPLTVTINYQAADIAGLDESTLQIRRFNTSTNAWEILSNCSVNTSAKEVTCQTSQFSDFGLFGAKSQEVNLGNNSSAGFLVFLITLAIFAPVLGQQIIVAQRFHRLR